MTFDEAQRSGVVNMVPHDPPIPPANSRLLSEGGEGK